MLAVGTDSGFAQSTGAVGGALCVAAFALVGAILLFAAYRLCRKHKGPNNRHYTLPRH